MKRWERTELAPTREHVVSDDFSGLERSPCALTYVWGKFPPCLKLYLRDKIPWKAFMCIFSVFDWDKQWKFFGFNSDDVICCIRAESKLCNRINLINTGKEEEFVVNDIYRKAHRLGLQINWICISFSRLYLNTRTTANWGWMSLSKSRLKVRKGYMRMQLKRLSFNVCWGFCNIILPIKLHS